MLSETAKKNNVLNKPEASPVSIDDVKDINLTELFYCFLDHWKLLFLSLVVCVSFAGFATKMWIPNEYSASSMIYILNPSDSVVNLSELQLSNYLAFDYLQIFETRELNGMVIENLKLPYSWSQLKSMVKVSNLDNTRIIRIKVTSNNQEEPALIANEMARCASIYISEVLVTDKPTILSKAFPPVGPSGPNMISNCIIAGMGGLIIASAYLILRFLLDDKVKSADQFTELTQIPIFAEIPVLNAKGNNKHGYYSSLRNAENADKKKGKAQRKESRK